MSTTAPVGGVVPEWTLGHRLWRSRRLTGETQAELAARLGVGLKTIKEAEADKRIPKRAVILGWAVATGVDPHWLEHGTAEFPSGTTDCYVPDLRMATAA